MGIGLRLLYEGHRRQPMGWRTTKGEVTQRKLLRRRRDMSFKSGSDFNIPGKIQFLALGSIGGHRRRYPESPHQAMLTVHRDLAARNAVIAAPASGNETRRLTDTQCYVD